MNRKKYCPGDCNFKNYYTSQVGGGISDINVFRGLPYQRGYGIGSLFARFGIPVLKFLGKHLLSTGVAVGSDILAKRNAKESLKERAKEGAKIAAKEALNKISEKIDQTGKGLYKGTRKKTRTRKDIFS